jgi:hypothetical protein
MKKHILIVFLFFSLSLVKAQDYENAVGLRLGMSSGLTFKHFISTNDALEGILSSHFSNGFNLTGLYERHTGAFDTENLYFYYGAGAHLGSSDVNQVAIGIDGIVGLEYILTEIPINISLDWKPALNLIGSTDFWPFELGLSARYMF